MINVDTLFSRVRDLTRKDKAGYMSNAEFNRDLAEAQNLLYEYYFEQFEANQTFPEELSPFIKSTNLLLTNAKTPVPADFQHTLWVRYRDVSNPDECGGEPTVANRGAIPLLHSEIVLTLDSPIRQPSVAKKRYYYTVSEDYIEMWPDTLTGSIELKYLRTPAAATRAVTIDLGNDEENYDSTTSVQLEWGSHQFTNFVAIMLYFRGMAIKDQEITSWLMAKRPIVQQ